MLVPTLTALVFPVLLLAAPTPRDVSCTPSLYSISNFVLDATPGTQQVQFTFKSNFNDATGIVDPALAGSTCNASAGTDGSFPNEIPCSIGRGNLEVDLRGPEPSAEYQVIHFWQCNGKNWMSSTAVDINPNSSGKDFEPQNVREMPCGSPTCP